MDTRGAQARLARIGWPLKVDGVMGPKTRQAIKDFQEGWAGKKKFWLFHGRLTPYTQEAIEWSYANGGRCGAYAYNFFYREWKSRGNGWIKTDRELVIGLQKLRDKYDTSIKIVSGYRDGVYNRRVGGATHSQHLDGDAADIPGQFTAAQVKSVGVFTGIGINRANGRVLHVDVRSGSPRNPTIWYYG